MLRSPIRILFCLAAAVLSAAIADPLVEGASNAGWFGPGRFTDGSTIDVIPVLLLGLIALACNVAFRAYGSLRGRSAALPLLRASEEALSCGSGRLLPLAFTLQIGVLFAMETTEQFVVWHHGQGGTIWLGGPVAVSLCTHLAICVAVLWSLAAGVRALASTTVRIIRAVYAIVRPRAGNESPLRVRRRDPNAVAYRSILGYASVGQRGPPSPLNVLLLATLGEFLCSLVSQSAFRSSPSPSSAASS